MQEKRFLDSLERMATFTDTPGQGVTRFSWSEADRQARAYLNAELRDMGLSPWTDGIGNIRARMAGALPGPAVMIGSHLDSVRNGGRYDGTYGVIAALEVLRSLHDQGRIPPRDLEFIAFAEEEGSNFGCTCLGSKAITGQASLEDLKALHNDAGQNAYDILRNFGLNPDNLPAEQISPLSVMAYLELHIEQNAVLEQKNCSLGLVTAISGMRLHRITFHGRSDHAASPMLGRCDAMAAFAEVAWKMEQLWRDGHLPADFSCTIGKIESFPNVGIVIPNTVIFTIDIRHVDVQELERGWKRIEELLRSIAEERGIKADIVRLSASGGAHLSPALSARLHAEAVRHGVHPLAMISGPAHDAAAMGAVVPAALMFVPSIGGLSHCAQEKTAEQDLVLGVKVLENTISALE